MKQKKRKKKHNKVLYLGKNKLDCIELLISQAIIHLQISHEEFEMIVMRILKIQKMKILTIIKWLILLKKT